MSQRRQRETLLLTVDEIGDRFADVGPDTTVLSLARELNGSDDSTHLSLYVHRIGRTLPAALPVRAADVRSGDVVRVVLADPVTEAPLEVTKIGSRPVGATLHMLSGPLAGESFVLGDGGNTIGRVAENDIVVVDAGVSRQHATVTVQESGVWIEDHGSTNGIRIDGNLIEEPTEVQAGERILLGRCWVTIDFQMDDIEDDPYAETETALDAGLRYTRPVRTPIVFEPQYITLPAPPNLGGRRRRPSLSQGGGDKVLIHRFNASIDTLIARLEEWRQSEIATRSEAAPAIYNLIDGIGPRTALWPRRAGDADWLDLRVGLADQPSLITMDLPPGGDLELRQKVASVPDRFRYVPAVPAILNLSTVGTLGIEGSEESVVGVARSLVGQLVALHGPDQVGLICRAGADTGEWEWLKWLPHVDLTASSAGVAENGFVRWVTSLLNQAATALGRPPAVVVLLDDPATLPPGLFQKLLAEGPGLGVYTVLLGGQRFPSHTKVGSMLRVEASSATFHVSDGSQIVDIGVEMVDRAPMVAMARMLSPIVLEDAAPAAPNTAGQQPETDEVVIGRFEFGGDRPTRWATTAADEAVVAALAEVDPTPVDQTVVAAEPVLDDDVADDMADDAAEMDAADDAALESDVVESDEAAESDDDDETSEAVATDDAAESEEEPEDESEVTAESDTEAAVDDATIDTTADSETDSEPTDGQDDEPAEPSLLLSSLPPAEGDGRLILGTVQVQGREKPAVFAMNLPRDGSLGLVGPSGSGRSTVLQSVAAATGFLKIDPNRIPLVNYLDVPGQLAVLDAMPNAIGASKNDIDGFRSVVGDLEQMLVERKSALEAAGMVSVDEQRQRQPAAAFRRVVVLIDEIEAFQELLEALHAGRFVNLIGDLLDEGPRLGVHLVFTAHDRTLLGPELSPRVGRWLTLGGGDDETVRPGRARIGKNEVRFAPLTDAGDVETAVTELADKLIQRGAEPIDRTGTMPTAS